MSEIEKLRALLAEARPVLWLHRPAGDMDCDCRECSEIVDVVARIDAALAEPVKDWEQAANVWHRSWLQECETTAALVKERDEARGEARRLRILCDANAVEEARLKRERDEARAEVKALREAAASCVEREVDSLMLRAGLAADIRDLPVPEDK